MITLALFIVRCYPRSWRERYGVEVRGLLRDSAPGIRDALDLARGGIEAWCVITGLGRLGREALGLAIAIVVLVLPAFALGRTVHLLGWTPVNDLAWTPLPFAVLGQALPLLMLRVFWLSRRRRRAGDRVGPALDADRGIRLGRREVVYWRVAAFLCALSYFASTELDRFDLRMVLLSLVFSPAAMLPWIVDALAPAPWFMRRRPATGPEQSRGGKTVTGPT